MQDLLVTHIDNRAIKDLIEVRRKEYLQAPLRIVEDYNNENKNIDEYNGRQLLEMIQNANDESDTVKAKKVFIKVEENSLIIANNGNPFSLGGVESLMYSDLSPKTMEENKVGKKGLGFRSILNWSKEIYIASYHLHLKFSEQHASNFLKSVLEEKPEIKETLKRKTKKSIPISVLRCPYIETDSSKKKFANYDTVIELTLKDDESIYESIITQIEDDIVPEALIFLNKLEEIEVETPESHFQFKKNTGPEEGQITISKVDFLDEDYNQEWIWNILEDKGQIEGKEESKNYELKIAYNPKEEVSFHKLFSYFRTEVDFPYPVIAHGSFELKSDRNQLSRDKNDFNIQLIEKLAKLLVDCALKLTESDVSSYDALKLLIPSGFQHSSLFDYPWDFNDLIKESINKAAIFPTLNNTYITLDDEPIFYEVKIDHLIPEAYYSDFKGFLKSTSDETIINYLWKEQGELNYYQEEFTERINKIVDEEGFSIDQKVEWVSILCEHTKHFYYKENSVLPNLLINTKGEVIKTGKEEMILPPKGEIYELPKELELQFIEREFTEKLKGRISGDIRDLSLRLKAFQVDEYSMTVVARKVISASHKMLESTKDKNLSVISGMHSVLFQIYNGLKEEDRSGFFQNLPSPLLISKKGKLLNANKLYFGKGYDIGYLCENLLKSIKEDVFVGSLIVNGLDSLSEDHSVFKLEKYLKWIGVADMPRRKILDKNNIPNKQQYVDYIFDGLNYPYSLPGDHKTFETRQEINSTFDHDISVLWYDFFEEIIENTSIEFLLAWFIKDRDINNSIVLDSDHEKAELWFLFDRVQNYRYLEDNDVRSYILFFLKKTKFIPVDGGKKAIPTDCVANSGNLSPLVHSPQINYDANIFNFYNIKEDQVELLLKRLGVKESFKDLSIQVMYNLLNEHHKFFNKNGRSATVLYSAIIDATMNLPSGFEWDFIEREMYLENGYVLSIVNDKNEYVPVKEATYVLNPNHSQDLLAKLKVSKIRQRVGNTRIKDLFGVQPMDHIEFRVKDSSLNEPLNDEFQSEFNLLKPLLFVYREQKNLTTTQKNRELASLKELKIKICYNSDIEFNINNQTQELVLKDNEYVYDKQTQTYFVQVNKKFTSYSDLKQEYRFTETLSDIVCGALTVTENRKDFMLIIGQNQSKWKEIMTREFPDFVDIELRVMKNFEGALTSKQLFWKNVLEASKSEFKNTDLSDEKDIYKCMNENISWDNFYEIYRSLNYYELSLNGNYKLIKKMFNSLNIDIKDFNKYSKVDLDFNGYYLNLLRSLHNNVSKKYKSFLFLKGFSESFVEEIDAFESYDLATMDLPNSLNFDLKKLYECELSENSDFSQFEIVDNDVTDVEKVYADNLKTLKRQLQEENIFDRDLFMSLLYESDFKNNIYFSKYPELLETYKTRYLSEDEKRRTVSLSSDGKDIDIKDDEELMKQIEASIKATNLGIEFYTPERAEARQRDGGGINPGQSTYNQPSSGISKSDIGFIGEKYAFELLKKEYDEVIWKSEYAIRAGFSGGTDGFGYDFECIKDNETRFVEVKASTTSNKSFHISKNEIKIGHANSSNYDVLLISNLLSDNVRPKYLKNIFQYKEKDTFFENNSFLVLADGYKIKFN